MPAKPRIIIAQVAGSGTPATTRGPAGNEPDFPGDKNTKAAAKKSPSVPLIKSAVVMPLILKSSGPCLLPAAPLPLAISTPWLKLPNGVSEDISAAENTEPGRKTIEVGVTLR